MGIIKGPWHWFDERTGLSRFIGPIARHRVPKTGKAGWFFVFGSATLFSFLLQVVTGITLATVYNSSSGDAYNSLKYITNDAPFGYVLRGIHGWGAGVMTVLIGIHMARVFLFGSYKYPREVNWLSGVVLLLMTLAMGFTGQLLRWDQNAIWSTVVGAEQASRTPFIGKWFGEFILGGGTLGADTLSRFFSFHVFWIPAIMFLTIGFHLYLVLRNGISTVPEMGQAVDPKTYHRWYTDLLKRKGEPFWPDAAWRDVVFGVIVVAVTVALALIIGPTEIGKAPDPTIIRADPRPDWYFLWYFSILALIPAASESVIIIFFPLLLGVLIILLPFISNKGERHPLRRPWTIGVILLAVIVIVPLTIAGEISPWVPRFDAKPLAQSDLAGNVNPQVVQGMQLFHDKACEYCHQINGNGGIRGPDLTKVGDRLSADQIKTRISVGANNMPAYGANLTADELNALVAFLESRKSYPDKQLTSASSK
ncbi:MAG TPA: cytochrome b N-terminal domain-containing protein [Chloroflexia bacterium]|nr:cytochrome b N-terminal domain-containing protein [Chloroflexia bacterium]